MQGDEADAKAVTFATIPEWKSEQVAKHLRNCIVVFTKLAYCPGSLVPKPLNDEENFRKPEVGMKGYVAALFCVCIMLFVGACNSGPAASPMAVEVSVSGAFKFQEVGSGAVTLKAAVTGDPGNHGVTWTLSQANTDCSPACGTLQPLLSSPTTSAIYTPPTSVPVNQQATITARSIMDGRQNFVFNFQITAPITVSIAPKFSTKTDGGPATSLSASVNNDPTNSGVTWTFTVGGTALTCSNSSPNPCSGTASGTLTPSPAPGLTAQYQPPNTAVPSGDAQPTITATSNGDTTKSDSFSFTLVAPPISVSISNKFSTTTSGGSAATINAVITNDQFYSNAGVTWTLTSTVNGVTGLCSPTCGNLTPTSSPSLSASYTPPATAPTDANANPTITVTSVSDSTKSDSFAFNILSPASVFKGAYVFQLRGFDTNGHPMARAGVFTSDGLGNITGAELDTNDNFSVTSLSGLSGTYTLDTTTFPGIPRPTVCIALVSGACSTVGGTGTVVLKGALSSDGTRAKIIEYDSSLALMAGSMLKQDPTALTGASVAGNYAFELDSDAGTSTINGTTTTGRIVEAGQFIIGTGATSITGGVADAAQAQQPTFLAGGVNFATIAAGAATAPDAAGRGTFTLAVSGSNGTYTANYAYYVANSKQLDLIEVDTGGTLLTVQSGTAQRQNITANSLDNLTSVVALTGSAPLNGSPAPAVIIGLVTISGQAIAQAPVSINFEENVAGASNPGQSPSIPNPGTIFSPLDPTTGRALLFNTFFTSAAVYLYGSGQGFLIDISSSNSHAYSGPLIPQTGSPFTAASDIAGNYIAVAGGSSSPLIPNLDYAASFDAAGNYTAVVDFTTSDLAAIPNGQVASSTLTGQYSNPLSDPVAGLGQWSFTHAVVGDFNCDPTVNPACNPPGPTYGAFYMIGPRQFVAIGQGPRGGGGEPSGIFFFEPQ